MDKLVVKNSVHYHLKKKKEFSTFAEKSGYGASSVCEDEVEDVRSINSSVSCSLKANLASLLHANSFAFVSEYTCDIWVLSRFPGYIGYIPNLSIASPLLEVLALRNLHASSAFSTSSYNSPKILKSIIHHIIQLRNDQK